MFELFTDSARLVVALAQDQARSSRHNYTGTEHLLLGLLLEGTSEAARVLKVNDARYIAVRLQVENVVGQGQQSPNGPMPFTYNATKVLERSLVEAEAARRVAVSPEHVLLAIISQGGVATRVLRLLGVDLDDMRGQLLTGS